MGAAHWPVTLQHGQVRLRPLSVIDERVYHRVRDRNRDWTREWDSTRPPESEGPGLTFREMVRRFARDARAGRCLPWAIAWVEEGVRRPPLIGQMTISGITWGSARWGMAGYWVDVGHAGRGIAPAALALAADHMFGPMRLHRLEVAIRPENVKSLRVVEKLGFRFEGQRPAYLHVNHAWRDHLMFALHADEVGEGGLVGRLGR